MDKSQKVNAIRAKVDDPLSESVICAVLDANNGDVEAAVKVLKPVHEEVSFERQIAYLKELYVYPGIPESFYIDSILQSNGDLSTALDILIKRVGDEEEKKRKAEQEKRRVEEEKRKAEEEKRKAEEEKRKAQEAGKKAQEEKKKAEEEKKRAEEKKKAEEEKKKAEEKKKQPSPAAPDHSLPPTKPLPDPMEEARRREEHMQGAKEQLAKKMEELEKHKKELEKMLQEKETAEQDAKAIRDEIHKCDFQQSVIQKSCIAGPARKDSAPDPKAGRVPTEECEITVTGVSEDRVISFTWKIPEKYETSRKDCIGLYIHDREFSNKYEKIFMLEGKHEGSGSFEAPTIGYYDLRYYPNYSSIEHSRSKPFLVGPEMTVNAKLQDRRKIVVSWNTAAQTDGDWLALYSSGTYSNVKYIQWCKASSANSDGEVTFDAPRTPGSYEVRYFFTSKKHASGYAYSGISEPIVIPNEDKMEVLATHPVVKVRWQVFSQEPYSKDWIGVFPSSENNARPLGWTYLSTKGLMDSVGDHGIAEIEVSSLSRLLPPPEGQLPAEADKYEIRIYNRAPNQPYLRIPFVSKQ